MNDLTQRGIQALKSGDRATARKLLAGAVKQDPNDAAAWLWLTGALDTDEERAACLRQVLRIDPGNQTAARGLAQIVERGKAQPARKVPATQEVSAAQEVPATQEVPAAVGKQPAADELSTEDEAAEPAFDPIPLSRLSEVVPAPVQTPAYRAPASIESPAPTAPAAQPAARAAPRPAREKKPAASTEAPRIIFRTRPSMVPALACFWLFLIGALILAVLLNQQSTQGLVLAGVVGLLLQLVVLYAILRTFATRYELTSQYLSMRFRGRRVQVYLDDIASVETRQNAAQKIIGVGDIHLDAAVNGELVQLRMRSVPLFQKRAEEILYLVKDRR
jgi:hypothetical protein